MKLSVVIPVYNEVGTIAKVVQAVEAADTGLDKEIIIVDDCSTDGTGEALRGIKATLSHVVLKEHAVNEGKGAALRTGIDAATGATRVDGLFSGGDCISKGAEIVDAVQEGKIAAFGIDVYLGGSGSL